MNQTSVGEPSEEGVLQLDPSNTPKGDRYDRTRHCSTGG